MEKTFDLQQLEKILHSQNISSREKEILYSSAYGMYEAADYEKATNLFLHLTLYSPKETRFWKGLASSYQMQHQFKEALHAWSIVCLLSRHDPFAHFHAAECYLSMGETGEAKKALQCAQYHLEQTHPLFEKVDQLIQRVKNG